MTADCSSVFFSEGFLARGQEAVLADDPYNSGSPSSEAWIAGWSCADAEATGFYRPVADRRFPRSDTAKLCPPNAKDAD
jgi:hypothetical protein